jgi:hypothetical protein
LVEMDEPQSSWSLPPKFRITDVSHRIWPLCTFLSWILCLLIVVL